MLSALPAYQHVSLSLDWAHGGGDLSTYFDQHDFLTQQHYLPQQHQNLTFNTSFLLDDECRLNGILDSLESSMPDDLAVAIAESELSSKNNAERIKLPADEDDDFNALLQMVDFIETQPIEHVEPSLPFFDPEHAQLQVLLAEIDEFVSSSSDDSMSAEVSLPQKRKLAEVDQDEEVIPRPSTPPHKKEANKRAAIRYRSKKLKEKDALFEECADYARRNQQLRAQIDDVQGEISLIKSLLVQALIVKNGK